MQPDLGFVTINTDISVISRFIDEVILQPRLNVLRWSSTTKQTPGLRIGYPAQHLASLVTGVEGSRTGARGDDLVDGTEVKGCNRIDQLDTCSSCGQKVLRMEEICSVCNSNQISRKNDSKWLLTIRSESELELLTKKVDRVLLILLDYPEFSIGQFDTARILIYEVWPQSSPKFVQICNDYYNSIYLPHIANNPKKTPAPKNFWPESYQFYLCNPIKVFECEFQHFNTAPKATINFYHPATVSRSGLIPESARISLFKPEEIDIIYDQHSSISNTDDVLKRWAHVRKDSLIKKRQLIKQMKDDDLTIQSSLLACLPLRDTSVAQPQSSTYLRR